MVASKKGIGVSYRPHPAPHVRVKGALEGDQPARRFIGPGGGAGGRGGRGGGGLGLGG